MSDLNSTPSANRLHIGFFGCRNAGKSSLVNAVTGQELAVVSSCKGTTTDPVKKAMELAPLGPVVIIDTPGFDDIGTLGNKRILKTKQILNKTDIAVLVVDKNTGINDFDKELLAVFEEKQIPHIIAINKCDKEEKKSYGKNCICVSATTGFNINALKELIAHIIPAVPEKPIVSDLLPKNGSAVLVVPIDKAAPKGRLILPQQQVIRDLLDHGMTATVTRETELAETLDRFSATPDIVITDSQVFGYVAKTTPEEIPLTSFSVLMARYKGFLKAAIDGIKAIDTLSDNDKILIAEGCSHHRQCEDIGTVKLPKMIEKCTGKKISFKTCSGTQFPDDLSEFSVIIHCGGCMLNEREMRYRLKCAEDHGIPFTNYGTVLAHANGILERSIKCLDGKFD